MPRLTRIDVAHDSMNLEDFRMVSHIDLWPIISAPFVGSFLATVAVRLPEGRPIAIARSTCPNCAGRIGLLSLIPIVSWVAQRARCRACGGGISAHYPIIEVAALGLALWAGCVFSGWLLVATCVLGWALLVSAAIDFRTYRLPDAVTFTVLLLGVGLTAMTAPERLAPSAVAAGVALLGFWLLDALYQRLRGRVGLGQGDMKLIAAGTIWVGADGLGSMIVMAAASALLFAAGRGLAYGGLRADTRVPFGPFLALGLWIAWLHGPILPRLFP